MKLPQCASRFAPPGLLLLLLAVQVGCGGGSDVNSNSATNQNSSGNGSPNKGISEKPGAVGGTISGLSGGSIGILVNNGTDFVIFGTDSTYTFDQLLTAGQPYNVSVYTNPAGATCTVSNGTGVIDQQGDGVGNISINCANAAVAIPTFVVSVAVTGLASGNSVTLALNGSYPLVVRGNGLAVFSQVLSVDENESPYAPGSYDVSIVTNPSGQTCTLSNAIGSNVGANSGAVVQVAATCS